jgi:hypothetical protein
MKLPTLLAAAALIAVTLAAGSAQAQGITLRARTAGDLADMCGASPREPTGPAKLNYCDGFAQGAVDVELRRAGDKKPFCIPPSTKRETTMREYADWVRSIPSRRSQDAVSGLFTFMAERFPCK